MRIALCYFCFVGKKVAVTTHSSASHSTNLAPRRKAAGDIAHGAHLVGGEGGEAGGRDEVAGIDEGLEEVGLIADEGGDRLNVGFGVET